MAKLGTVPGGLLADGKQRATMGEPDYDVAVNVHKHAVNGYGIYFTNKEGVIKVTKLDAGSEAALAGVQANDELVFVQDMNKKLPETDPGSVVEVTAANYQATLQMVRNMTYCRLGFQSPGFS